MISRLNDIFVVSISIPFLHSLNDLLYRLNDISRLNEIHVVLIAILIFLFSDK